MGWGYGFVNGRDVGYGVPAECDKPGCTEEINRGLACICGSDIGGGEYGCGLFFCYAHLTYRTPRGEDHSVQLCPRCYRYRRPYEPKPDVPEWLRWKLRDASWYEWRKENPDEVAAIRDRLRAAAHLPDADQTQSRSGSSQAA